MAILMAMRLVWVPFHLAHELHDDEHELAVRSTHVEHGAGDREHGHEHAREHGHPRGRDDGDHGGDHEPHPSAEHRSELITRDASYDPGLLLLPIVASTATARGEPSGAVPAFRADAVPKSRVAWATRARAPPVS